MKTVLVMFLISFCSSVLAMDPQAESLKQKQLLLHYQNAVNIKFKEAMLPTDKPEVHLAIIHNKVTFLQESEVKSLPQDLATLYCLIGEKHYNEKRVAKELVQKCTDAHPEFVQKLVDKKIFQEAYTNLSQQVEVVNQRIDQLGNDELKSLLHAFVTFYSVRRGEK